MIKVDESDPVGEVDPSFPPRDVQIKRNTNVRDFYDLQTEIGRGKFGTVFRCREKATGLALAAKFVSVVRREDRRNVEKEVDIMRSLQHPRLIQMYDAYEFEQTVCVVLELIEGGELFERVIDDDFVLTEKACTVFMRQICEGIDFVHTQKILHLDLKPENILCLTKTGNRIKIIDFGLARRYEPGKKLQVLFGTPEFVAPEVVNFDQIGFNTDMWSVGVICYVLLSGLSPFMGDTDIETMANVTVAKYDFDDEVFDDISDDAKDFISKLLVKEKEKRMCTTMCLNHKWLRRPKAKTPTAPPVRVETPKKSLSASASAPASAPASATLIQEPEMRGSKGNLRSTVERWTEHPEDPYIFDTACHTISPCPSLVSVLSADPQIQIEALPTPPLSPALNQPSAPTLKPTNLLHDRLLASTERRASDSSCLRLKSHHIDINDRINLADEIRKLSDKLFRMASQSQSSETVTTENGRTKTTTTSTTTTTTFVKQVNGGDPISTTTKSKIVKTKYNRTDSPLGSCFTAKATSNQIPTKKFWPIEPGKIQVEGTINPEEEAAILAAGLKNNRRRLSKEAIRPTRTLSSTSSNTTHSAPPSPRWSPDPELPPPPTPELTKDLLMRLFQKLDSNREDEWRLGSEVISPASRLLFRSPRPSLVIDKKHYIITTHSGGV